ncbi:MAG TPA: bifunctional metallophosphatase/5'-nucleotidase [Bacteroidia bacterium]|jgi:sulfur-oxidizing protein SoxB|nr:bifunctional metallophosphatase/5'-nucleotidase [Bacteroidia bacterium]
MSDKKCNNPNCNCSCHHEPLDNVTEKKSEHDNERRDFLKYLGLGAVGLGLGPAITYWLREEGKISEIIKNPAIVKGKAQRFTILHTSDIHGQLDIHDEFFWQNGKPVFKKRGGFATLKTMVDELRKQNPLNTLLVDGGDCFQGSAIASLTEGTGIVPLANKLNYDLVLPGNWEVAYGKRMLMHDMNNYSAAKVCANMFDNDDLDHDLMFPPYQIFNLGGTKIGFIGYNDPLTPVRQSPAYSKGIKFTKPEVNLQKYVKILRDEKHCDMVFVLSHMGLSQQVHLANQKYAEGVDYILGADTHERVREPLQGKFSKVTEPGAFGSFIGKLDIVIENGKIKDEVYELLDVDPEKYLPDAEMTHEIEKVKRPYKKILNEVLGQSKTPLLRYYIIETPMDNLITDAVMWKFKTDIAVSNGFRFCPPLIPDPKTGLADITREYLWSMLPVNSEVKVADVKGKQILNWLEKELENAFSPDANKRFGGWFVRFNGMKVTFTIGNEKGKRVQEVCIKDQPLELDKTYTMVACERDGDPDNVLCRMLNVHNPVKQGIFLHSVLEDYLAEFSPVSPKIEGRSIATDAPDTLLTQALAGINYQFR